MSHVGYSLRSYLHSMLLASDLYLSMPAYSILFKTLSEVALVMSSRNLYCNVLSLEENAVEFAMLKFCTCCSSFKFLAISACLLQLNERVCIGIKRRDVTTVLVHRVSGMIFFDFMNCRQLTRLRLCILFHSLNRQSSDSNREVGFVGFVTCLRAC